MKTLSKLLSLMLCAALLFTLFPTAAMGAELPFRDVTSDDWFYSSLEYVYKNGLMKGTGAHAFSPAGETSRAMIVTILYNLEEHPEVEAASFNDVAENAWYAQPVAWAKANGIVKGYNKSSFGPNDAVTRQQFATILCNYAAFRGYSLVDGADLNTFTDVDQISDWALEAMAWANAAALIIGVSNSRLDPQGSATRAQTAAVFQRFCENVVLPASRVTVTFDFNYTGAPAAESVTAQNGETIAEPKAPSRSGYRFTGWYTEKTGGKLFDFKTPVEGDVTLYARWTIDSTVGGGTVPPTPTPTPTPTGEPDNKTLDPLIEAEFGTSTELDDTDGDGLSDYTEIMETDTDPLVEDTDENGVNDPFEDHDEDGLTNIEEQTVGTNSSFTDTDGDGLSDYVEVKVYQTDPLNPDSDRDGLTDAEELLLGLDPLSPCSDGTIPDSDRVFSQTAGSDEGILDDTLSSSENWLHPSISGDVPGVLANHILLSSCSVYSFDGNRSVVSDILELQTDYPESSPLTLSFSYETEYTGDILDLSIVKLENEELTPVDTTLDVDAKMLSGEITGEGVYFVLDLNAFLKGLGIDVFGSISTEDPTGSDVDAALFEEDAESSAPIWDNTGTIIGYAEAQAAPERKYHNDAALFESSESATKKADIVFVIDTTGSMTDAIYSVKQNIAAFAQELVKSYNIDANFSLIEYRDILEDGVGSTILHKNLYSNWYTNVDTFVTELGILQVDGGGDTPETPIDGLEIARNLDWRGDAVKFVVLVTDADYKTDNSYGYLSMEQIAKRFQDDGIIVSAITYSESIYQQLTALTDGVYGYIYGNFRDTLLLLADRIGKAAEGEWVFLDDYQAVRLKDSLENAAYTDSDEDGLSDAEELGTSKLKSMKLYINRLLRNHSVPEETYTGKLFLTVWSYKSNPTLLDTDYDGISDGTKDFDGSNVTPDPSPRNTFNGSVTGETFEGSTSANDFTFDVEFRVDYSLFFKNLSNYQKKLSVLGIIYSLGAYGNQFTMKGDLSGKLSMESLMTALGLKSVEKYHLANYYTDDDISEIVMGHRVVKYQGNERDIIIVAVRGTNATIEEWSSNFDVGADTDSYWDRNNLDWKNKDHHKGFDVAANRLSDLIDEYVSGLDSRIPKVFYFTGHSRGAAVANILGKLYLDKGYLVTSYSFATPNTTLSSDYNAKKYSSLFSVVNEDDLVPYLPLEDWGFRNYGKTYSVSIRDSYEDKFGWYDDGTWEKMFGMDYNYNGNLNDTLKAFSKIVDNRDDLYEYTGEDDTFYTYKTAYNSKSSVNEAIYAQMEKHGERISKFCHYYSLLKLNGNYYVSVEQTPAAMMMILTDVVAGEQYDGSSKKIKYSQRGSGEDSFVGNDIGFFVAKRYQKAKSEFVWSGSDSAADIAMKLRLGGMVHSHMPGTYYLIAQDEKELIP
ncbi:MAG: S-layer homology domain-containing protein [Oscillospiraceae bacterium]|nr:S-layer homology domain-containing protein [Oscillospiraceae bacterium]